MKLIDRYIIRQFSTTALFSFAAVTIVFIVIDAMEKLDDFLDREADLTLIMTYYIYSIPEIIKLITPVAILLACLFVTARMSTQNELTAMKSGGISLYRIMVPYLCVALLVTAGAIYFNGWVVPTANQQRFNIERVHLQKNIIYGSAANIYFQDSPTRILSIGFYDDFRKTASRVSIQDFNTTNLTAMVGRMDASSMVWDSTARQWILHNGTQRWFEGGRETLKEFARQPAGRLNFDADDLRKKQEKPDEMDYYTLKTFIENQQRAGQDVARWQVDFHSKISFPFATVVVVLFGVPFAYIKRRGGVGVQTGISVLICFIYIIFMKISQVFGYNGDINPLLTAWLANIMFLVAAGLVMVRVPK
jgi:lipopolysaccharide export system permease protein